MYIKLYSVLIAITIAICMSANCEELTDENWRQILDNNQEWMIEFMAPWCPSCQRLQPVWEQFTLKAKELNIRIGSVDLTKYPSLSGLFSVTSLPTIYHVKDKQYRVYEGNRELYDLIEFVQEKKWQDVKPISSWLTPDSTIMQIVSYLFKGTLYFKDLYTVLTESYGVPAIVVIIAFVIATIALGLFLGIILIICIDFICAPKKYEPQTPVPADDLSSTNDESNSEDKSKSGSKTKADSPQSTKQGKKKQKSKNKKMNKHSHMHQVR